MDHDTQRLFVRQILGAYKTMMRTLLRKATHTVLGKWPENVVLKKYYKRPMLNVGCGSNIIEGAVNLDSMLPEAGCEVDLLPGVTATDFFDLPEDEGWRTIIAKHVWEHNERNAFLNHAFKLLVDGGHLCIILPDIDTLGRKYYWERPGHVWAASRNGILQHIHPRDWTLVQFDRLGRWGYPWSFDIVLQKGGETT
jgi:hypothetical protein